MGKFNLMEIDNKQNLLRSVENNFTSINQGSPERRPLIPLYQKNKEDRNSNEKTGKKLILRLEKKNDLSLTNTNANINTINNTDFPKSNRQNFLNTNANVKNNNFYITQ